MINELIKNIEVVTTESSLSVCDKIIDMINKSDLIYEYSENNDFIMESMMIFMESKNRQRDKTPRNDISKWMKEKGYWYEGDNPKKKKECMRMYHFLQQHKFDPYSHTYESDIDDGKGGKKRLLLDIDNPDSSNKILNKMVRRGENAYYQSTNGAIYMGSKELKRKQYEPQLTLKHEEGHAYSNLEGSKETGWFNDFKNYNLPEDDKANQHLKEAKENGKTINKHDDSTEELYADLYGAKNAKFRTKKPGKTRKANINDIERFFKNMSNGLRGWDESLETESNRLKDELRKINNIIKQQQFSTETASIYMAYFVFESSHHYTDLHHASRTLKQLEKEFIDEKELLNELAEGSPDIADQKKRLNDIAKQINELNSSVFKLIETTKIKDDVPYIPPGESEKFEEATRSKRKSTLPENVEFLKGLFKKYEKHIVKLQTKLREELKQTTDIKRKTKYVWDQSTKVRFDFVKKYINEYFESLYYDYDLFVG